MPPELEQQHVEERRAGHLEQRLRHVGGQRAEAACRGRRTGSRLDRSCGALVAAPCGCQACGFGQRPLSGTRLPAAVDASAAAIFVDSGAGRRYAPRMRSIRDAVQRMTPAAGPAAGSRAVLFPELAGTPAVPLAQGILRAPPRGRAPPPWLSALRAGSDRRSAPDVATPGRCWPSGAGKSRRCWRAPPRRAGRLVAARVGGNWWLGAMTASCRRRAAMRVVALAEPALPVAAPCRRTTLLAAMLDAAFAGTPGPSASWFWRRRIDRACCGTARERRERAAPS